jgi:hypothetical protein
MCLLHFDKACSAATQSPQEKNKSADEQWGNVNITGFIWTEAS